MSPPNVSVLLAKPQRELAPLLSHVHTLQRLRQHVNQCLSAQLRPHYEVANYRAHCLVIHAESSAWATRLRYLAPALIKQLKQFQEFAGLEALEIKTRPRTETMAPSRPPAHMSGKAAAIVESLADSVTDPQLKAALLRLSANGNAR